MSAQRKECDPSMFEMPVRPIGVSGGTAAFYRLQLRPAFLDSHGGSTDYYIGKDLAHAEDEVDFYEDALAIASKSKGSALSKLLEFMCNYAGILGAPVDGAKPVNLLVLRNLRDGCHHFRMLDLKVGQKTSAANWKGKSRYRSARQDVIDACTNSTEEGFRLEGIDGITPVLQSMSKVYCGGDSGSGQNKSFRKVLQQFRCTEVLMHFLDVHQLPEDTGDDALDANLSPAELSEIVHRDVAVKLLQLALACRNVTVPQKWIGSSVALCFDCGRVLPRSTKNDHADQARDLGIKVHIFDWGRSDLNTEEKHQKLDQATRRDYMRFWRYYIRGIDRLGWEAVRAYRHRFTNSKKWQEALLTVWDFDGSMSDQIIGHVRISPLVETGDTVALITDREGLPIRQGDHATLPRLTYSARWRAYPHNSKFRGAWRISVKSAQNLPRVSTMALPNPYVEVVGTSEKATSCISHQLSCRQVTTVQNSTVDPEWRETFELTIVMEESELSGIVNTMSSGLAEDEAKRISSSLPPQQAVVEAISRHCRIPSQELFSWPTNGGEESSASTPRSDAKTRAGRDTIIVENLLGDEAAFAEWEDLLNKVCFPLATQSANNRLDDWSSIAPRAGHRLRFVHQSSVWVRVLAIIGEVVSLVMAVIVIVNAIFALIQEARRPDARSEQSASQTEAGKDEGLWPCLLRLFLALCQLAFVPTLIIMELKPRTVVAIGLSRYQDALMDCLMLHKLLARGCFYVAQGIMWGILDAGIQHLLIGSYCLTVGLLLLFTYSGLMRRSDERKVQYTSADNVREVGIVSRADSSLPLFHDNENVEVEMKDRSTCHQAPGAVRPSSTCSRS